MRNIVLIAHDIRSTHNIGALLRTADGFGVSEVILSGYTPYPTMKNDPRLPHLAAKIARQIGKTALGAEKYVAWRHYEGDLPALLASLRAEGYRLVGLEQAPRAVKLPDYHPPDKIALLLGREVEGIDPEYLDMLDDIVELPMLGHKESLNVVQAAAAALYHLRFA